MINKYNYNIVTLGGKFKNEGNFFEIIAKVAP
jgi:hypothetical protein